MATFTPTGKSGQGWTFDQVGITFDGPNDSVSGSVIKFDGLGTLPAYTPLSKS